jgi:hypothetical protein
MRKIGLEKGSVPFNTLSPETHLLRRRRRTLPTKNNNNTKKTVHWKTAANFVEQRDMDDRKRQINEDKPKSETA